MRRTIHRRGRWFALAGLTILVGACVLRTETVSGPTGAPGPKGDPGTPGATSVTIDGGTVSMQDLADLVATQQQAIAALQAQVQALSNPECPLGYTSSPNPVTPDVVRCVLGESGHEYDEVVRVGSGGAAFWIDRFEASVWADSIATVGSQPGVPYGGAGSFPSTFPSNGQVSSRTNLLYARSRKGVLPTTFITWFQAQVACAASGKRLPTDDEWTLAAMGTPDPTSQSDGSNGTCVTQAPEKRLTGAAKAENNCASIWGAEDMIGNVNEYTTAWYTSVGPPNAPEFPWPSSYGKDGTWGVSAVLANNVSYMPAVSQRGGFWQLGTGAGVFSMFLLTAPSDDGAGASGFRCVILR